jgi:methyl-accepting chemotaxis protein
LAGDACAAGRRRAVRSGVLPDPWSFANLLLPLATGDLTHTCPVTTKHEVRQLSEALNTMCADLKRTVGKILTNSRSLEVSASELGTTAEQLNVRAR